MYKNGKIAPLMISPGVMIRCPKGSYADTYKGIPTGKMKINAFLDHSNASQAQIYEAICEIHSFLEAHYKKDSIHVNFPMCMLQPHLITSACPPLRTPEPASVPAISDPLCDNSAPSRTLSHHPPDLLDFCSGTSPSTPLFC